MNKLEDARLKIEEIDKKMADLFIERMEAVKKVLEYKIENDMNVFDGTREQALIEKNKKYVPEEFRPYYVKYLIDLMNISKEYQKNHYE